MINMGGNQLNTALNTRSGSAVDDDDVVVILQVMIMKRMILQQKW